MIDRRSFLHTLLALPIAATVDVEQLLWTPKPIIVVPSMTVTERLIVQSRISLDDINRITLETIMPGVVDSFFRTSPLWEALR